MPLEIKYLHNNSGVVITGRDTVTGSELISAMKDIFSDREKSMAYRYGLVDFSGNEQMDISVAQIVELSKIHVQASKWNSNIVVGFAIRNTFIYGLVSIWQIFARHTNWKIRLSRSLDENREWLEKELNLIF